MRNTSKIVLGIIAGLPAAFPLMARADTVLGASSVTTNMGNGTGNITNVISQTGLSAPYTSGVTNFAAYTSTATDDGSFSHLWQASFTTTSGNVDFDLGSAHTVNALAFWNSSVNGNQVTSFTVFGASNSAFTGATNLGTFAPSLGGSPTSAQVFSFTSTSDEFFRMQINSNGGGTFTGMQSVAFSQTPEPGTLMLLSLPAALGLLRRRSPNR